MFPVGERTHGLWAMEYTTTATWAGQRANLDFVIGRGGHAAERYTVENIISKYFGQWDAFKMRGFV